MEGNFLLGNLNLNALLRVKVLCSRNRYLQSCLVLDPLLMVTEKAHAGFVGRAERPIGDDLDLAEVLNFTRVLVLPDLGLAHLNILWNYVDQIEKLLAIVGSGHDNASLRLWISQVLLSLGK